MTLLTTTLFSIPGHPSDTIIMPHKEVKITCKSSCGHHTLAGILTSPTNRAATELVHGEAQSVVVLLHGAMANKNSFYHKTLAANLAGMSHHNHQDRSYVVPIICVYHCCLCRNAHSCLKQLSSQNSLNHIQSFFVGEQFYRTSAYC